MSLSRSPGRALLIALSIVLASAGAAHAHPTLYLPYAYGQAYEITQAPGGSFSHTDQYNRYAVDFGLPAGTAVVASAPGTVKSAVNSCTTDKACNYGWGNAVALSHGGDGHTSLYAHLSRTVVANGQQVQQGQLIGYSGCTGNCYGAHLHWSMMTSGGMVGTSVSSTFVEGTPYQGARLVSQNPSPQPAYATQITHQDFPAHLETGTGQTGWVEIHARNTGTATWDGLVRLAAANDQPFRLAVSGTLGGNRVEFERTGMGQDGLIAPGETAVFRYELRAPDSYATAFKQGYHLVREGTGPHFGLELVPWIPVVASSPSLFPPELRPEDCTNVRYVTQSGSPAENGWLVVTDQQPGTFTFVLENRNVLCPLWRDGVRPFRLATRRPTDRSSGFASSGQGWIASNRIAMTERLAAPGSSVRFTFEMKPASWVPIGDYAEYVAGVVDGLVHLPDLGWYVPTRRR